jgi:hypothetical protein
LLTRVICLLSLVLASGGAFAETITVSDLAGAAVEANINRRQTMQREGRTSSVQTHQHWEFEIGTDKTINMTVRSTFHTPRGTREAPPNSGRFSLEDARDVASRGGGKGIWNFDDGALHFTRTFPSGAYRAHFTFSRVNGELRCEVTEAFARQDGNKPITLASPVDGGKVTILDSKQEPSDCKVTAPNTQ